jgi:membrane associated rhomboid family serine protease
MGREPNAERVTWASIKAELKLHWRLLFGLLGVMWLSEIVDTLLGGRLDGLGIRPRIVDGLVGIPLAPFLHSGFAHLIGNTIPFLVLGWLVLLRETRHFIAVFVATTLLGGLGVWLLGHSGTHIGASGVVFGLLGYLLLVGWLERSIGTILLSAFVGLNYGWTLLGVLPLQRGVSWEGHLFGFLTGGAMAWLLAKRRAAERRRARSSAR